MIIYHKFVIKTCQKLLRSFLLLTIFVEKANIQNRVKYYYLYSDLLLIFIFSFLGSLILNIEIIIFKYLGSLYMIKMYF